MLLARKTSFAAACGLALAACSSSPGLGSTGPSSTPEPEPTAHVDSFDVPLRGIDRAWTADFNDGDLLFSTPMREADGLGPLYTRQSCSSCHQEGIRGPGLVQKMSIVDEDGVTPAEDQSALEFGHTLHPLTAGGGVTPILAPEGDPRVKVTTRFGPPVLGRGYMEAIADEEIERVEGEQAARDDGIHGRINHVHYASLENEDKRFHDHRKGDLLIGRFGLKARVPALDDFTADAFQGDMGITSPLRPDEIKNPDGLTDDAKPGIDVSFDSVNLRAAYVRLLAIPERQADELGAALFEQALCSACHVPSLHTRADYPVPSLADVDAPVYTDLLLHAMGPDLADGLPADPSVDGEAGSFDWRTAPLLGLRFNRTYLHDGRAKTIEEAILMHRGEGSEANPAVDAFESLDAADQASLVDFVHGL
ncbi:MAG TPA: di-heme oxidoredictase family protein [Polyangiaceae bacterium]|nr:di-heme oxidoredictase family protein [Polyangiaceae bacterium]